MTELKYSKHNADLSGSSSATCILPWKFNVYLILIFCLIKVVVSKISVQDGGKS